MVFEERSRQREQMHHRRGVHRILHFDADAVIDDRLRRLDQDNRQSDPSYCKAKPTEKPIIRVIDDFSHHGAGEIGGNDAQSSDKKRQEDD